MLEEECKHMKGAGGEELEEVIRVSCIQIDHLKAPGITSSLSAASAPCVAAAPLFPESCFGDEKQIIAQLVCRLG